MSGLCPLSNSNQNDIQEQKVHVKISHAGTAHDKIFAEYGVGILWFQLPIEYLLAMRHLENNEESSMVSLASHS